MKIPVTRYRLQRTPDGGGGFTVDVLNSVDLFGVFRLKEQSEILTVDRHEDLRIEDVVRVADEMDGLDAFYRVARIEQQASAHYRAFTVQRIDRPLWPLDLNYLYYNGQQLFFNGQPIYYEA